MGVECFYCSDDVQKVWNYHGVPVCEECRNKILWGDISELKKMGVKGDELKLKNLVIKQDGN